MSFTVEFVEGETAAVVLLPVGKSVLDACREARFALDAVCGGRGTCRKCVLRDAATGEQFLACQRHPGPGAVLVVSRVSRQNAAAVADAALVAGSKIPAVAVAVAVAPDDGKKDCYLVGVCIDIGTTTLALTLCCFARGGSALVIAGAARRNPQAAIGGADVVSRIACVEHGSDLQSPLLFELASMLSEAFSKTPAAGAAVDAVVVVGNTAMREIFLGRDVSPLGRTPFLIPSVEAVCVNAGGLGSSSSTTEEFRRVFGAETAMHILPVVGGHVGADLVAAALACGIADAPREETWVLADIGTNCEVAVAHGGRILACSCPTGPALEGANISHGMLATLGAINHVHCARRDDFDVEFTVVASEGPKRMHSDDGSALGICGSGLISALAAMLSAGVLLPSGRWSSGAELSNRFARRGSARTSAFVLDKGSGVSVSGNDVRALQLAKAALFAGTKELFLLLGVSRADRVLVAGAFGSAIDLESARTIGLLPECGSTSQIRQIGNAAMDGAISVLTGGMSKASELAKHIEHVDISKSPTFQDNYVAAMPFPLPSEAEH